jgi:uncharacterized protein YgiM (DUF1202 family)
MKKATKTLVAAVTLLTLIGCAPTSAPTTAPTQPATQATTKPATTEGSGSVSPDSTANGETMVTTDRLNIRTGPGTSYTVITTLDVNTSVKVVGYKSGVSGWAYVTGGGYTGWVSTDYLD